jgi:hypothetical protein
LFSNFNSEQSTQEQDDRNIKNNISKIEELMDALAALKNDYDEKLTSFSQSGQVTKEEVSK